MAVDGFIDRLLVTDAIYVIFEQKSVGSRFLDSNDYVHVSNTVDPINASTFQVLAIDSITVRDIGASLKVIGEVFVNDTDSVNVLNEGQDFDIELSLLEKNPLVKSKRVVKTTFSPSVYWA